MQQMQSQAIDLAEPQFLRLFCGRVPNASGLSMLHARRTARQLRRVESRRAEAALLEAVMKEVAKGGSPVNAGRVQAASLEYRLAVAAVKKAAWQLAELKEKGTAWIHAGASE